jgi:CrcB protein
LQALRPSHTPTLDRRELTAIFLGGAAGALLRVWLGVTFASAATAWPWSIFLINVTGCFALGCLATLLQERPLRSPAPHPLLAAGFCGAYSTFATMQIELLQMLQHDRYALAFGYAAASVTAGYFAIWLATTTTRRRVRVLA